jgi:hypothetical protein
MDIAKHRVKVTSDLVLNLLLLTVCLAVSFIIFVAAWNPLWMP